jgi:hypothetical protein
MIAIFVRSPYHIIIDEPDQVLTKVEIYIAAGDTSFTTEPTIVLEKQIADVNNRACNFNISPYIKDYIENIAPASLEYLFDEEFNMWRKVVAVSYYKENINDAWTELDVIELIAVNGYTNYMNGYNQAVTSDLIYLVNSNINLKRADDYQYFNVLVDYKKDTGNDLIAYYRDLTNTVIGDVTILSASNDERVYMLKIPYRLPELSGLANGSSVQLILDPTEEPRPPKMYFLNEDVCLYTPIKCSFINQFGGWQFITFFKASSTTYDTKAKEYNLLPDSVDYNPLRGQKKSFNFEQTQKIKVNTGWVDENYIELLSDLTNSETVLLDNMPVNLTSRQIQKKTRLKDKMINYEMEFEYAFNLINDVI